MFTLPRNAIEETAPVAVVGIPYESREEIQYLPQELRGKWFRVFPKTGRDVQFLRMTQHHVDRFAPASGHGVLLAARCLPGLDRKTQ
jgi:hypothetical protein